MCWALCSEVCNLWMVLASSNHWKLYQTLTISGHWSQGKDKESCKKPYRQKLIVSHRNRLRVMTLYSISHRFVAVYRQNHIHLLHNRIQQKIQWITISIAWKVRFVSLTRLGSILVSWIWIITSKGALLQDQYSLYSTSLRTLQSTQLHSFWKTTDHFREADCLPLLSLSIKLVSVENYWSAETRTAPMDLPPNPVWGQCQDLVYNFA